MTEALVLGAGMAGICTALALQARGRAVTLVDRGPPGRETSYGNAGIIQAEAAEPYALPRAPGTLLRMALGRDNGLNYHPRSLPGHAGPLWRYFRASAPARHREVSQVYSRLTAQATGSHGALIEAAGAQALVRRDGFLLVRRDAAAFEAELRDAERLSRDYGVAFRALDAEALALAEPNLRRPLPGAIHWTDSWSCADPGGLAEAYAALFAARGGAVAQGDAASLRREGAGWRVETADGPVTAPDVVVALGPWSPALLAPLGFNVPMVRKRGYHRHRRTAAGPDLPVVDADYGAVLAPMRQGLRILTGAELAAPEAAPTPRQLMRAEAAAAELFDLGAPVENAPWMGVRPCLPEMLPLAGRAPRRDGLWLHFGHGHQGFTLGPVTAELLARSMDGERDALIDALSPAARPWLA